MTRNQYYGINSAQPLDFIIENRCLFAEGNILKYLFRAGIKNKHTYIEDLEKALFYLKCDIDKRKLKAYSIHTLNAREILRAMLDNYKETSEQNNIPQRNEIYELLYAAFYLCIDLQVVRENLEKILHNARNESLGKILEVH